MKSATIIVGEMTRKGARACPRSVNGSHGDVVTTPVSKKFEIMTFVSTTFVVIPGLAVAFVGAFGLAIWIFQMIYGPPGPPPA